MFMHEQAYSDTESPDTESMVRLAGGVFAMGCEDYYSEESPIRRVSVSPFLIDRTPVTNRQFAAFVSATDYVMLAEQSPDPALYPGILPEMMEAGSIVFVAPEAAIHMSHKNWWQYVSGASWRQPYGPNTRLDASDGNLDTSKNRLLGGCLNLFSTYACYVRDFAGPDMTGIEPQSRRNPSLTGI